MVGNLCTLVNRFGASDDHNLRNGASARYFSSEESILHAQSVGGKENDIVRAERDVGLGGILFGGELVGGEGITLVRSENGDTGRLRNDYDTGEVAEYQRRAQQRAHRYDETADEQEGILLRL